MQLRDFLKTYWPSILTVVVTMLTLIIIFQAIGVDFSPIEDKHIQKVVTIESFQTDPSQEVIPNNNNHDHKALHDTCTTHSKRACKTASYCVLLDGDSCVGGNKHGPSYLTKDGNKVDYKYYYYKHKCYGKCPDESD